MRGAIVKAFWARDLAKQEDDRYIMGPTTDKEYDFGPGRLQHPR